MLVDLPMADFWSVLMALTVVVLPLGLAWLLLGWMARRKARSATLRTRGKR